MTTDKPVTTDKWTRWLLNGRDGDSADLRARHAPQLTTFRDGVLDRAGLKPDEVLLDVGCGTGLIGFGALGRLGPRGRVIFSDISQDLLDLCRRTADGDERCSFVRASADELTGVADASVDVVTTRSVLIYCDRDRKAAAFAEFHRVLRPGGRLSIFEPVNRFAAQHRSVDLFGVAAPEVDDLLARTRQGMQDSTADAERPLIDFDERDLLEWAVAAGFTAAELDYRAEIDVPDEPITDWAALKRAAPNPLAPTYGAAMAAALSPQECERLDAYMTALVAAGTPTRRTMASAYLRALRP